MCFGKQTPRYKFDPFGHNTAKEKRKMKVRFFTGSASRKSSRGSLIRLIVLFGLVILLLYYLFFEMLLCYLLSDEFAVPEPIFSTVNIFYRWTVHSV